MMKEFTLQDIVQTLAFGFSSHYLNLETIGTFNDGRELVTEGKEPTFIIYVGSVEIGRMPQSEMVTLKEEVFARAIVSPWAWLKMLKGVFRQIAGILGTTILATPMLVAWSIYLFESDTSALLTTKKLQFFMVLFSDIFHLVLMLCVFFKMAKLALKEFSISNAEGVFVLKTLNRDNPFQLDLEKELRLKFKVLNPGELTVQLFV